MDEYNIMRDPEMAPRLLTLVNEKLRNTRQMLEEMRKDNDALRAEVARLKDAQNTAGGAEAESATVKSLRRELESERATNRRLLGENVDLRAVLESVRVKEKTYNESPTRVQDVGIGCSNGCQAHNEVVRLQDALNGASAQLDQQMSAYNDIQERVTELQQQLECSEATCEAQADQIKDLQAKLVGKNADAGALQKRIEEQQQQWSAKESEFINLEYRLRQDVELMTSKYYRYKTLFLESTNSRPAAMLPAPQQPHTPAQPPLDAPPPAGHQLTAQSSQLVHIPGPTMPDEPWFEIVDRVLSRPCLPLGDASAPFHLPPQVKEHLPGPASVLSCPHRITYPFSQGLARLIAPKARCKGSAAPSELGPPTHELEKLVGARKEMFFHAEGGICYAGTFVGTDVGDMSREEYVALPKAMKEAIVRHTFPSKAESNAARSAGSADRVRNAYMQGAFTTQYLVLKYLGHNRPLADALMALNAIPSAGGSGSREAERPRTPAVAESARGQERAERPRTPAAPEPQRAQYVVAKPKTPYVPERARSPYAPERSRSPYAPERGRSPLPANRPRTPYARHRASTPHTSRAPYIASGTRTPYPKDVARSPYTTNRSRTPFHDNRSRSPSPLDYRRPERTVDRARTPPYSEDSRSVYRRPSSERSYSGQANIRSPRPRRAMGSADAWRTVDSPRAQRPVDSPRPRYRPDSPRPLRATDTPQIPNGTRARRVMEPPRVQQSPSSSSEREEILQATPMAGYRAGAKRRAVSGPEGSPRRVGVKRVRSAAYRRD